MAPSDLQFDPREPSVRADPYPLFRRLREEDPLHRSEALGAWVLTRYDDVKQAVNDPRFSADRISPFRDSLSGEARAGIADLLATLGDWMVFNDPPRHTRLRALAGKAFTPRIGEALVPRIQAIIDDLIDNVAETGRMDLIRDFAYPLPVLVIAHLLGVPKADQDRFKRWSDELATFVGSAQATPDKRQRAQDAIAAMADYFRIIIAARRETPRNDVLSDLVVAESRGDRISQAELVATCTLLLFAGHETTTNLIGNGMLALLRHPDQYAALVRRLDLAASAVEEVLRYDGPALAMTRIAQTDMVFHDRTIRAGDRIFAMLGAANRDPRRFDDPERLDVARQDNRHIGFGYGIHFCLGAPLARLEGRLALRALMRRLPGMTLAGPEPEWIDSLSLRGVTGLELRFARLAASG